MLAASNTGKLSAIYHASTGYGSGESPSILPSLPATTTTLTATICVKQFATRSIRPVANCDFVRINALLDQVKRDNAISIVISWTQAHNNAERFIDKLNAVACLETIWPGLPPTLGHQTFKQPSTAIINT